MFQKKTPPLLDGCSRITYLELTNATKNEKPNCSRSYASALPEITALTDALCRDKLNEEYAQVCREMTSTLARKRLSPLVTGQAKSWACAIAYTVGSVNFLFDKSQTPTLRADELCAWFGLSKSTGGNKSSQIKQILKIGLMDPHWTLPSQMEHNPIAWKVIVNGFIMDARALPRPLQEEAYRKGLIPYLPDEKDIE